MPQYINVRSLRAGQDALLYGMRLASGGSGLELRSASDGGKVADLVKPTEAARQQDDRMRMSRIGGYALMGKRLVVETMDGASIYEAK